MGFVSVSSRISRSSSVERLDVVEKVWIVEIRAVETTARLLMIERDESLTKEFIVSGGTFENCSGVFAIILYYSY